MKPYLLILLAGLTLLLPILGWLHSPQGPTIIYPFPLLVLLPSILFGLRGFAVIVPALFFLLWNSRLYDGEGEIPKRSYILLIIATLLSVVWFSVGWTDGLSVQGAKYNYSVTAINLAWIGVLCLLFKRSRRTQPSFQTSLTLHWLMFVWLSWYAFPFFGEIT